MNGEDLNSRWDQSPSRWVINFRDWPLEKATEYPDCFDIVERLAKPERERNNRKVYRDRWWHHAERRPELYATIAGMSQVTAVAATSRTLAFCQVHAGLVFSHTTYVLPMPERWQFGVLQSMAHDAWVREYCSSMKGDLRYTPTDGVETFPFPSFRSSLESIGERYYSHRRNITTARHEGLTVIYNRFHSPHEVSHDIATLRAFHVEMDHAVAAAYDWRDLDLGHGFHETKQGIRYTISEAARRKVLDLLLALNHERHAAEESARPVSGAPKKSKGGKKRQPTEESPTLF